MGETLTIGIETPDEGIAVIDLHVIGIREDDGRDDVGRLFLSNV